MMWNLPGAFAMPIGQAVPRLDHGVFSERVFPSISRASRLAAKVALREAVASPLAEQPCDYETLTAIAAVR